jgi:DNA replication and repair protein RecF
MLLLSLGAENFRNLSGKLDFSQGLNILVGENGQGKTNWLEAIAVLASARSFRTSRLTEAVRFDESSAFLYGRVQESAEIMRELRVGLTGNTKTLLVNGKKETLQRYLTNLHAIVFNADELEIVRGTPDARRRFLDEGIVSLHPPFVQVLTDYNKVIRQKNSLLQSFEDARPSAEAAAEMLDPWNSQLVKLAGRVHRARVRFVDRINDVLHKHLFGREELTIRYRSSLEDKGDLSDYEALITERLALRVQAEIASGHCLIGTHRDDLDINFDGHDLRKYGSAGQQRSALLLLQLANIAVFHATRAEYPLFLLDDIDAELDYRRIGQLLEFLEGKTQLFVSTSKESFVERFGSSASTFHIASGSAEIQ